MHFLHFFRLWIPVRCAGKYKRLSPTATGYFILSPFPPHIYHPWKTPYWFLPCFWKTCKQSNFLPHYLLQWDHLYNKLCPQPRRLIYLSRCTQEVFTLSFLHFPLWPPLRQVLSFLLFSEPYRSLQDQKLRQALYRLIISYWIHKDSFFLLRNTSPP